MIERDLIWMKYGLAAALPIALILSAGTGAPITLGGRFFLGAFAVYHMQRHA